MSNVLNLALPPQRLRPVTRREHQDPVSHMVQQGQFESFSGMDKAAEEEMFSSLSVRSYYLRTSLFYSFQEPLTPPGDSQRIALAEEFSLAKNKR